MVESSEDTQRRQVILDGPEGIAPYCIVSAGPIERGKWSLRETADVMTERAAAGAFAAGQRDSWITTGPFYIKNLTESRVLEVSVRGGADLGTLQPGAEKWFHGYFNDAKLLCEEIHQMWRENQGLDDSPDDGTNGDDGTGTDGDDGTGGADGTGGDGGLGSGLPIPGVVPGVSGLSSELTTVIVALLVLAALAVAT